MSTPAPRPQLDEVPGAFNLRELGGTAVEGGVISDRVVFRCDLLNRLDPEAAYGWLDRNRVTTVIDLRTELERERDGFITTRDGVTAHHVSLLTDVWAWEDEHAAEDGWFLRDRTIEMFSENPERVLSVLGLLADAGDSVLFHCTAGKDRTGVVSSGLLGLLGASKETIVADYARSTDAMPGIVNWYREQNGNIERDLERERAVIERAATRETMQGVVEAIEARYGSYLQWARDAGGSSDLIDALRRRFVLPASLRF